jgi:hypothetical protein
VSEAEREAGSVMVEAHLLPRRIHVTGLARRLDHLPIPVSPSLSHFGERATVRILVASGADDRQGPIERRRATGDHSHDAMTLRALHLRVGSREDEAGLRVIES